MPFCPAVSRASRWAIQTPPTRSARAHGFGNHTDAVGSVVIWMSRGGPVGELMLEGAEGPTSFVSLLARRGGTRRGRVPNRTGGNRSSQPLPHGRGCNCLQPRRNPIRAATVREPAARQERETPIRLSSTRVAHAGRVRANRGGESRRRAAPNNRGGTGKSPPKSRSGQRRRRIAPKNRGGAGESLRKRAGRRRRSATLAVVCRSRWWGWTSPTSAEALGSAQPAYRAKQIYQPLRGQAPDLVQISTLPQGLRQDLAARHTVGLPEIARVYQSADGTRRYLLRLEDGRTVETVLMPEGERDTICISSQVGCPVECKFCMTALLGLERSLTAGEIVGQVLLVVRENSLRQDGGRLNIVMMDRASRCSTSERHQGQRAFCSTPRASRSSPAPHHGFDGRHRSRIADLGPRAGAP